jgi:hypothetical protein
VFTPYTRMTSVWARLLMPLAALDRFCVEISKLLLQLLHLMLDIGALGSGCLALGRLLLCIDALRLKVYDLLQAAGSQDFVISHGC